EALSRFTPKGTVLPPDIAGRLDQALIGTERALTAPAGLPGRSWYKNLIYAPGLYTGYGAQTLPGVRTAVEQRSFETVAAQIRAAAEAVVRCGERIEEAAGILERALGAGPTAR